MEITGFWRGVSTSFWRDHGVWGSLRVRCVLRERGSVPAITVGLQPWELPCPGARMWGDWDPGAVTEQTEDLSPVAGGIHTCAHMCGCLYIYLFN